MADGKNTAQKPSAKAGAANMLAKRLSVPLMLEEKGPPRFTESLLIVGGFFIAGLIIWSSLTEIKEMARAEGEITPIGRVYLVQHLEGGILSDILVHEGEVVEKGEVLARFQPIAATGDLGQLLARRVSLELQSERLNAYLDDRDMDPSMEEKSPALFQTEVASLMTQRQRAERQRQGIIFQLEQNRSSIDSLILQRKNLKRQVDLITEQVAMKGKLVEKGLVSRVTYLETQRTLEQTRGQLIGIAGDLASAREAAHETEAQLAELDATLENDALVALTSATSELAEVASTISKLKDRVDRLDVRATTTGIVQQVTSTGIGEIIEPGGMVAQIVPIDDELVAEVKVSPNDIGHVALGDPAQIKITTYDPARYGALEGNVKKISATTFRDEEGEPYYKTVIALNSTHVGREAAQHAVLPGMVVNAEIITGSKSLTRYLLKPVYRALDNAFTER
ncbi:MAG: HlyD family secretion protein/adhesin transport system membrane fusion protein [Parvibaculaceae bacterium]|jgi:HlyD family secretion protein/adhesin transport system membrane fusion protein